MTTKYTIEHRGGCILIFGAVPAAKLFQFANLLDEPKGAVISPDLARMSGATFAFGQKADIAKLIEVLTPGAISGVRAQTAGLGLPEGAAEWLAAGERGLSSECMFQYLTGHAIGADRCVEPSDPDDFKRCRKLLDQVPALKQSLHRMAEVSHSWSRLVQSWDEICAAMDEEWGWPVRSDAQRATRTYELIKKATHE